LMAVSTLFFKMGESQENGENGGRKGAPLQDGVGKSTGEVIEHRIEKFKLGEFGDGLRVECFARCAEIKSDKIQQEG